MASTASLPPPPGQPPPDASPSPVGTSAPAQPSPGVDATTQAMIRIIRDLRSVATASPAAAPGVQKINDIIQSEIMPKLMESQQPGEPQAPPTGGG